jgi:hypothetical protein
VLYILIFLSGIASGFLNVVAGGGSLLTLPLLTLLGMGIDVANGTNRIAILLQNIVAVRNFHKNRVLPGELLSLIEVRASCFTETVSLSTGVNSDSSCPTNNPHKRFVCHRIFIIYHSQFFCQ